MKTKIILHRFSKNGDLEIQFLINKTSVPTIPFKDIQKCVDEFMCMSTDRLGHKEYIVKLDGELLINDKTYLDNNQ